VLNTIHPLPSYLINQIAAGEVIERPASVVKELVENGLDADAANITIELGDGGLDFVSVVDDGSGIAVYDIHAALKRHWTSKLSKYNDLATITSLGFRGEALASIAAVADVEIVTRTDSDTHAWRVTVTPETPPTSPEPCRGAFGTTVRVCDLFHHVPARRRFLKRSRTEYLHVRRLVQRFGFASPRVGLKLSHDGRRGLHLRPASRGESSQRWRSLFGESFAETAKPIDIVVGNVHLWGWVGTPELARNSSELQYLALNGRQIRDRHIAHAIRLAFEESLAPGKVPVYALAIDLPIDEVDVNVHPGKLEVRFAELRTIHDLVFSVAREALDSPADLTPVRPSPVVPTMSQTKSGRESVGASADLPRANLLAEYLGRPLVLVEDRFLLFLIGSELHGLDLCHAWNKVITARFIKTGTEPEVASRPLLIPERFDSNALCRDPTIIGDLRNLGFEIDDLGVGGYVLRSVPAVLPEFATREFCLEIGRFKSRHDVITAVAHSAATSANLGETGLLSMDALHEFLWAATAADLDPKAFIFKIKGSDLHRLATYVE